MINRTKYCIANFKMNKTPHEAHEYLDSLEKLLTKPTMNRLEELNLKIVVCPSFMSIPGLTSAYVRFGAQNIHTRESGAYTGEVSASMLKELSCKYCIILSFTTYSPLRFSRVSWK